MCVPTPKAPPPAPEREEPKEMTKEEIYKSTPHMAAKKKKPGKVSGKQMLKTDLNIANTDSGLNIG